MSPADVKVGELYRAVDFGTLVFVRDSRTEHCTYTPGSVVKVVGRSARHKHIATELLMGAVTEAGRDFVANEYGLYGLWVHADELEPLDPDQHATNTPTCDSVTNDTKEPAYGP